MTAPTSPAQRRSRRIMLAIGVVALAALAGPWIWRAWQEAQLTQGKTEVFSADTARPDQEVALCLLKRGDDAVALDIVSEDHFTNPARGLAVTIEHHGARRILRAWLTPGQALSPAEHDRLARCGSATKS